MACNDRINNTFREELFFLMGSVVNPDQIGFAVDTGKGSNLI